VLDGPVESEVQVGHTTQAEPAGQLPAQERQHPREGLGRLRPGGLVVVDNTLWSGRVADPENAEADTVAMRHFNEHLHRDERVDLSLVPVGDGLTLARKR
jgi:predicted O-methyltransferase YrrM